MSGDSSDCIYVCVCVSHKGPIADSRVVDRSRSVIARPLLVFFPLVFMWKKQKRINIKHT